MTAKEMYALMLQFERQFAKDMKACGMPAKAIRLNRHGSKYEWSAA